MWDSLRGCRQLQCLMVAFNLAVGQTFENEDAISRMGILSRGPSLKALVTDAHLRSSVAGIRALGAARISVMALAPSWLGAGLRSRHARFRATGGDAVADPAGYAARVGDLGAEFGPLVVYPGQEAAIDALLAAPPALLEKVILPYSSSESLTVVRNKRSLAALSAGAGLRAPTTLFEGTAAELLNYRISPPFVLKPARPGGTLRSAKQIDSETELHSRLVGMPADEPLLAQERSPGPLTAVALVLDRAGRLVSRFQQEARRTWPPEAGPSSLAVSVPPDDDLVACSARLLAEVGYSGLAELQFVGNGRDRELIDVNTRFYGSLPLALAAGVNLPAAWHACVTGAPTPSPGEYRVGVTYRWLEADLTAALRGTPRLLLDRAGSPRTGSMWASDDPLASVFLATSALGVRIRRRMPKYARVMARCWSARGPRARAARGSPPRP